mmetsp:Transcript_54098/g.139745  ORF Transcript_54098/g.139745 Transcript_54098/m.139745 type:complete len:240 (-) Transcript_54098:25-744(-)
MPIISGCQIVLLALLVLLLGNAVVRDRADLKQTLALLSGKKKEEKRRRELQRQQRAQQRQLRQQSTLQGSKSRGSLTRQSSKQSMLTRSASRTSLSSERSSRISLTRQQSSVLPTPPPSPPTSARYEVPSSTPQEVDRGADDRASPEQGARSRTVLAGSPVHTAMPPSSISTPPRASPSLVRVLPIVTPQHDSKRHDTPKHDTPQYKSTTLRATQCESLEGCPLRCAVRRDREEVAQGC